MKKILFRVAILGLCISTMGLVQAKSCNSSSSSSSKKFPISFQPYLGIEYQYEHIKPAKAYRNFISANFQYANFFVGTRINRWFGVEAGYYRDLKNNQQQNQAFQFNGQQASGVTSTVTNSKYKGFSIDCAGYYQVDSDFHASAIIGLMTMHPTMTFSSPSNTNLGKAFNLITAKNNTVPRLGFGLDLLTKHWGCRTRIFWVYTQSVKLNVSAAQSAFSGITANPYVQAILATAGIYYRF